MAFRYSDFTPVKSRRKRKQESASPMALLQQACAELNRSSWWAECRELIQQIPPDIVCLGLGSPASSVNARAQLAFLLALCDAFGIDHKQVSLHDPVFTDADMALLTELSFQVSPLRHIQPAISSPTLFFMPHCDLELYEQVLAANWSGETLRQMLFISNNFADYMDHNASHKLQEKAPCLLRIAPHLRCLPLPDSVEWPSAFNNIAIQSVQESGWSESSLIEAPK